MKSELPRLGVWLLRLQRLGDRRADVEADLIELFESRITSHGIDYARRRFLLDVMSLRPRAARGRPAAATWHGWYSAFGQDVLYALRIFRRQAGVFSIAIGGLGIAIALTTTVFAITNVFNFRPLGVSDPDAVVGIRLKASPQPAVGRTLLVNLTYSDFRRLRDVVRLVTLEASVQSSPVVADIPRGEGQNVDVRFVTGTFGGTFGARTMFGRALGPADDVRGAPAVAVVHHAYWRARLGSDPAVVGRTLYFNDVPVTVVGVFDSRSTGPFEVNRRPPAMQLPLSWASIIDPGALDDAGTSIVNVTGRLTRPATTQQAEAELSSLLIGSGVIGAATSGDGFSGVAVEPAGEVFTADDLAMVSIFMTIVGLVLLLAVTNVTNLLLAGATTRQAEIAARMALGASRYRIIRQLTTESLLLGLAGGAVGLAGAAWLTPLVGHFADVPPAVDLTVDARVYLFAVVVALVVGVACGLAPARFGSRGDLVTTLKGGSVPAGMAPRATRLRSAFLAIQAAASVMLLVLTALFTRVLIEAVQAPIGVDPDRLVVLSAFAPREGGHVPADQFWTIALDRVREVAGVEMVGLVEDPPYGEGFHAVPAMQNGSRYSLLQNKAHPAYFETSGFRFVQGRTFSNVEMAAAEPVAIITESLARDFWPGGGAVGSTLERVKPEFKDVRVIGVVTNGAPKVWPPNYIRAGVIFEPLDDLEVARMIVRIAAGAPPPLQAIRDAVIGIDEKRRPRLRLVSDGLRRDLQAPRLFASGAALVGGLALTLAVIGVFGVTAFVVSQRRREISIRLAIGADRIAIVRAVFGQGMRPIGIGLAAGLVLAFFATQVVGRMLAGVSPRDPISFAAAAAVLFTAAGIGVFVPARRAASLAPAAVLKEQ